MACPKSNLRCFILWNRRDRIDRTMYYVFSTMTDKQILEDMYLIHESLKRVCYIHEIYWSESIEPMQEYRSGQCRQSIYNAQSILEKIAIERGLPIQYY